MKYNVCTFYFQIAEWPYIDYPLVPIPLICEKVYKTDPLTQASRTFNIKYFPLRQRLACSLHRLQGSSLPSCVISFGPKESFSGYSYVALSRVCSSNQFLISDTFLSRERFQGPSFVRGFDLLVKELLRIKALNPNKLSLKELERLLTICPGEKDLLSLLPSTEESEENSITSSDHLEGSIS